MYLSERVTYLSVSSNKFEYRLVSAHSASQSPGRAQGTSLMFRGYQRIRRCKFEEEGDCRAE